ncbi:MAG: hypothetical protein JJU13_15990 [Balneolaceae bacterium]|nr:hypothetical protein [Balneolaceae bacterium]
MSLEKKMSGQEDSISGKKDEKPSHFIVIGASAGGLKALQEFLSHLPDELSDFSIIVIQHRNPSSQNVLQTLMFRFCIVFVRPQSGVIVNKHKMKATVNGNN